MPNSNHPAPDGPNTHGRSKKHIEFRFPNGAPDRWRTRGEDHEWTVGYVATLFNHTSELICCIGILSAGDVLIGQRFDEASGTVEGPEVRIPWTDIGSIEIA